MTRHPPPIIGRTAARLLRAPARLYDWHLGWLLGHRFLRLTHRGRITGRLHRTMLEVIGTGAEPGQVAVIAGLGPTADWYRNINASPAIEVAIGRHRYRHPDHRVLSEDQAFDVLAAYERRNRWVEPVIRRVLSRLLGWQYDSSAAARQRLVHERPVIEFTPHLHPTSREQHERLP